MDWDAVFEMGKRENVLGLVANTASPEQLGAERWAYARSVVAETFGQNCRYLGALATLDEALTARGVSVIALKGAALLHTAYRAHRSLRPMNDIDLLVRATDWTAVENTLRDAGYSNSKLTPRVWRRDALAFDLHEHMVGDRIHSRAIAFRFDEPALWRNSAPLDSYKSIRMLDVVHHFLFLAIHALKHGYARLLWLVDMALLLPTLDAEALTSAASATGCARVLAYTLQAMQGLLGTSIPPRMSMPRLNVWERRYVKAVIRRESPSVLGEIVMAFSVPTWGGRLRYLAEVCVPCAEELARLYPTTPAWRRPVTRLVHLLRMAWNEGHRWRAWLFTEDAARGGQRF